MELPALKKEILAAARDVEKQVIAWRRDFHAHPERGFEEKRTSGIAAAELKRLGLKTKRLANTGVVGIIECPKPTETIALRADMDALAMDEDNETSWYNIGILYEKVGKYDKAAEAYKKVTEISEEDAEGWSAYGNALFRSRDYGGAVKAYQNSMKLEEDEGVAYVLGKAYQQLGRTKEAVNALDKSLDINPKNDKAWYRKGMIFEKEGRKKEALHCYTNALNLNPKNKNAMEGKKRCQV